MEKINKAALVPLSVCTLNDSKQINRFKAQLQLKDRKILFILILAFK